MPTSQNPPPSASDPINILVVDDQSGIRLTLKGILGKRGYKVTIAESGEQAIEEVRKQHFQLILMDIKMPGISGVDAFIQIKEISPDTTVILMTAYAMETEIRRAIQEGAYTVIYKPFDMEKVLSLIGECLEKKTLVMVVDDRVEDRNLIRTILEAKGYRVVEAQSGEDCVQKVLERRFHVVLLDVKLPGMDGVETLKQVKKTRPDTVVIIVSALTGQELLEEAMKSGSFAYLRKPFVVDDLLGALQKGLGSLK